MIVVRVQISVRILAQFESNLIRERTNTGLKTARARVRKGGSPAKPDAKQIAEIRRLSDSNTVTVNQIASMMGVGRATAYQPLAN